MRRILISNLLISIFILGLGFWFLPAHNPGYSQSNNLISNSSVETASSVSTIPQDWYKDFYGRITKKFTYPVAGYASDRGLWVEISKYTSGDAKWAFNDVPVVGSTAYRYSDFYKSNINSYLIIRYKLKNGNYRYVDLATLNWSENWTQTSHTFTTPSNATSLTVYHLIKNVGWLATDDFSLTPESPPPVPTPTPFPTAVPTDMPAITPTPTPIIDTPTPTSVVPTNTPILTPVPDTPTPTSVIDPPTPTQDPLPTGISTPTDTPVPTPTPTPLIDTPTPTNVVPTDIPASTPTPSSLPTDIPPTPTLTSTPLPTDTPPPLPTNTPAPTNNPTPLPTPQGNIISNPSVETSISGVTPDSWLQGTWGTNSTTFIYPVPGFSGDKAAKLDITQYTDGDSKWYFSDVPVTPGLEYTFRNSYLSTVPSSLVVRYTDQASGAFSYVTLANFNPTSGWSTSSINFPVPAGVSSLTIFHLINSVGSLTVDDYSLAPVPPPPTFAKGIVSLDFDDGWLSTFQNGLPILDSAGFKSTQYIVTGYMANAPGYVSAAQVQQMAAAGHDIQSHSQTHADLVTLTQSQMTAEVCGSRQDLTNIGLTPISFAFPYGSWNQSVLDTVVSCGYSASRTALITDGGFNYPTQNPYLLKTFDVESSTTLVDIQSAIDSAATNHTWLILLMHGVSGDGSQYDTPPSKLQSIVDYLKTSNVDVLTVSQGLARLN